MNKQQTGFTLIEMVIVIILLGILAAVAVPRLAGVTDSARDGVKEATLGTLKSAWSIAYALARTSPTPAQVAAQVLDPVCTANAADFTCAGIFLRDGTTVAQFGFTLDTELGGLATAIDRPRDIVLPVTP